MIRLEAPHARACVENPRVFRNQSEEPSFQIRLELFQATVELNRGSSNQEMNGKEAI